MKTVLISINTIIIFTIYSIKIKCQKEDTNNDIIGIDLGLTNIYVAYYNQTTFNTSLILNEKELNYTPTAISYLDYGSAVGNDAIYLAKAENNTKRTVTDVIQLLGKNFSDMDVQSIKYNAEYNLIDKDGKGLLAVEIKYIDKDKTIFPSIQLMGKLIIKKIRTFSRDTEELENVNKAVIAIPVHFKEIQRNAIKSACEAIQFELVSLIEKPIAAAIAHKVESSTSKNILVLDLSGTFFEVTILNVLQDQYKIIASQSTNDISGNLIINKVLNYFIDIIKTKHFSYINQDKSKVLRLKLKIINAIKELSQKDKDKVIISSTKKLLEPSKLKEVLTKEDFNNLIKEYLPLMGDFIVKTLSDNKMNIDNIEEVILVGGSMNINLIQDYLNKRLNKIIKIKVKPEEIVAYGAAEKGYLLRIEKSIGSDGVHGVGDSALKKSDL